MTSISDKTNMFLYNMILSYEARSLVSGGILEGSHAEVSTEFYLKSNIEISPLIITKIIKACWGGLIEEHTKVEFSNAIDRNDHLSRVQEEVIKGLELVSVRFSVLKGVYRFYIAINHALSDETTLSEIVSAIKFLGRYGVSDTLNRLDCYRQEYERYVRLQELTIGNIEENAVTEGITPAKVRNDGPLSWREDKALLVIRGNNLFPTKKKAMDCTIKWLCGENLLHECDLVCSSRNWRNGRSLGMQTGLVPIFLNGAVYPQSHCLELVSRLSPVYKKLFKSCISSEVFINGSMSRSIDYKKKSSRSFPVGIDFLETREGNYEIVLEGRFCNGSDLIRSLEKLSKYI
ncbi:hypothetical protein CKF94_20255 [Vibrio coralliilyticus]|uniref:hypothetical protein n=1 Tax=Vibrio coralliilyticus TaxID=190893 RepID=UPI000BAAAB95|nr:hypothetical protein [Vibrio coralliilyticus]MCC2524255.1 hypothetical protein [Vibrio coralliilyticus]PAU36404.1 hypothetical protein CKF94_20255 [Vibrio coralliilyticus]